MIQKADPERYKRFLIDSQRQAEQHYDKYRQLAGITVPEIEVPDEPESAPGA